MNNESESEEETYPMAQKCARCGRYLLQSQKIVKDPKHKNWYSHANCVRLYHKRVKKITPSINDNEVEIVKEAIVIDN